MPKSAAARKRQKQRKAAKRAGQPARPQGKKGLRPPIFRNPVPVQKKRKHAGSASNMSAAGGPSGRLGMGGMSNRATNRRSQVIEEDEFITDINGSVGFVTTAFPINPGQAGTFAWGSRIAQLYERYEFEWIEFYYKREVSEFATNGQTGKLILSVDYDASDPAPQTKQQVEAWWTRNDAMPCTPYVPLRLDAAQMRSSDAKYVRFGAQPAGTDIKTYDVGNLFVSTQGCQNTSAIGELHVRYRVRLFEPVLEAATVQGGVIHFSSITATTADNFAGSVLQTGGTPALTGITAAANVVTFPAGIPGNYLLTLAVSGATSAGALGATAGGGASALLLQTLSAVRDATGQRASAASTTTVSSMLQMTISVTTAGGTVTLSAPSTIVGAGSMDLFIVSLPATVLTLDAGFHSEELEELRAQFAEMRNVVRKLQVGSVGASCASAELTSDEEYESKTPELESSVHLSRSMAERLLKAVGGSK